MRLFQPVPPDGPSPRGDIAASWQRLHGADGWRGLLDPLHPDLRREIVRYGEFVDAAYGVFLSCPDAAPGDADAVSVPLQDAAYRVTAPLFATSSVGLPSLLALAAPCAAQRTSLVGYVAVCEIQRSVGAWMQNWKKGGREIRPTLMEHIFSCFPFCCLAICGDDSKIADQITSIPIFFVAFLFNFRTIENCSELQTIRIRTI
jgi:hypothetical protein